MRQFSSDLGGIQVESKTVVTNTLEYDHATSPAHAKLMTQSRQPLPSLTILFGMPAFALIITSALCAHASKPEQPTDKAAIKSPDKNAIKSQEGKGAQRLKCTVYNQNQFHVGQMIVTDAHTAVRVDLVRGNTTLVAKAPDWRVYMFNEGGKAGMEWSEKEFSDHTPVWSAILSSESEPTRAPNGQMVKPVLLSERLGPISYLGHDCIKYASRLALPDGTPVPGTKRKYLRYFYVLPAPSGQTKPGEIVGRMLKQPALPGIFIYAFDEHSREEVAKAAQRKANGAELGELFEAAKGNNVHEHPYLSTSSIRETTCDASLFDHPKILKHVKRECDILQFGAGNALLDVLK